MSKKTDKKTVNLSISTMERLIKHGRFGETYDELINRLLDSYERMADVKT